MYRIKQCDARAGLFVFVFIPAIFVFVALLKLPRTSQHVPDETHLSLKNAWLQQFPFSISVMLHSHYIGKNDFPLMGTVLNPL